MVFWLATERVCEKHYSEKLIWFSSSATLRMANSGIASPTPSYLKHVSLHWSSAAVVCSFCTGLDKLEALQNHENEEIYKLVYEIIETYFGGVCLYVYVCAAHCSHLICSLFFNLCKMLYVRSSVKLMWYMNLRIFTKLATTWLSDRWHCWASGGSTLDFFFHGGQLPEDEHYYSAVRYLNIIILNIQTFCTR